jgi:hypothetical protein
MSDTNKITWDHFFYAGQLDLKSEIEADMMWGLLQPKGSMFFARQEGTLAARRENSAGSIFQEIQFRYDIAMHLAERNIEVGNGSEDGRDYRTAQSQQTITFTRPAKGDLDISVGYFLYADIANPENLNLNTLGVIV